jgi:hypothetical protein
VAQQPNIEIEPADLPRPTPEPEAARRWTPRMRPGMITSPDQVPHGAGFGTPGPDTGYAIRLLRQLEGDLDPNLEAVLVALMAARASRHGRAPIREDLEVAKLVAGLGEGLPPALAERRARWLAAVPHERSRGRAAVADVDPGLLAKKPGDVRSLLTNRTL